MEPSQIPAHPDSDEPLGRTPRTSRDHHADLWSRLVERADALTTAVGAGQHDGQARSDLVKFLRGDILAHLQSEEQILYEALRKTGAHGLVAVLEIDHRFLLSLVDQIETADTGLEAALSTRALVVLFALRVEKEETIVLPALTEAGVDVSALLEGMVVRMASDYNARFTYL